MIEKPRSNLVSLNWALNQQQTYNDFYYYVLGMCWETRPTKNRRQLENQQLLSQGNLFIFT